MGPESCKIVAVLRLIGSAGEITPECIAINLGDPSADIIELTKLMESFDLVHIDNGYVKLTPAGRQYDLIKDNCEDCVLNHLQKHITPIKVEAD